MTYQPRRAPTERDLTIRGVSYHLREWGSPSAPPLVLVHGNRDLGASFQFMADALENEWHVIAPDWRGHGRSGWTPGSYWQAEFVADLDVLLDIVSPEHPVTLVGHSMGANLASLYAGMKPSRVRHLVMLDAMGELLHRPIIDVHVLFQRVLQARRERELRLYVTPAEFVTRLLQVNRRLDQARAEFLAHAWLRPVPGGYVRSGDPTLDRSLASLHRTEEWFAIWRHITAPVLYVPSSDFRANSPVNDPVELERRLAILADVRRVTAPETGHNVHHDAPAFVARLIERFARGELP